MTAAFAFGNLSILISTKWEMMQQNLADMKMRRRDTLQLKLEALNHRTGAQDEL